MSAGWRRGTAIARHEYKGLSKTTGALEDWVEKGRQENQHLDVRVRRSSRLREIEPWWQHGGVHILDDSYEEGTDEDYY